MFSSKCFSPDMIQVVSTSPSLKRAPRKSPLRQQRRNGWRNGSPHGLIMRTSSKS
jgi:hypothetical protein